MTDSMVPLKIWTDLSFDRFADGTGLVEMLIPFQGQGALERDAQLNIVSGRFDAFESQGRQYFEMSPLEEADVAVLPVRYPLAGVPAELGVAIEGFARQAQAAGKKTLVFAGGDQDIVDTGIPGALVFHISLYASKRAAHEFGMPQFFEDLVERYGGGSVLPRSKPQVPSVGFCGFAPPLKQKMGAFKVKEALRLLLNYAGAMKRQPSKSAHSYRARTLISLMRQRGSKRLVKTDFLIREQFAFAGAYGQLQPGGSEETARTFRQQYVDNLMGNDYNLCARGFANCSLRLWETLCCGRIPVFIDTDCVLPYDFAIDWKKHVVWVKEDEIERAPQIIAEFHNSLSDEQFAELQLSNRKLWEEYLSPQGFYKNIGRHLGHVNRTGHPKACKT